MLNFKTKKEALEFFRNMLARIEPEIKISDNDAEFLSELILKHPDYQIKAGTGIDFFFKRKNSFNYCFWIKRKDGTETDFSFLTCVSGKNKTPYQDFCKAARESIKDQISFAKKRFFMDGVIAGNMFKCPILGTLHGYEDLHLDHKPPMTFLEIIRLFLFENKITPCPSMINKGGDGCVITEFASPEMRVKFQEYHRGIAVLRLISKRANLSDVKKGIGDD